MILTPAPSATARARCAASAPWRCASRRRRRRRPHPPGRRGRRGRRGGPRGDLYIFLSVKPHELFERDGLDLLCTVPVPMARGARRRDRRALPDGRRDCDGECKVKVKVPEGAQTGRTVR
jgi:DnaJ-class molecular chaperone